MANDSLMTPLEKAVWEFLRAIRRAGELGEAKDHHRLNLKHPILAVSDRVLRDTVSLLVKVYTKVRFNYLDSVLAEIGDLFCALDEAGPL